ncbi:hypothetical protein CPB85DRAFT_1428242 [Mucidula mucida]|nr:hypothetical protein CPB85DRAFT_1428242 [Mucidula mucida]
MRLRQIPTSPTRNLAPGGSRLGTPMNASERSFEGSMRASVYSAMDIDEEGSVVSDRATPVPPTSTYFAKSDQLAVSFYSDLPVEVMQVLKTADFYGGAYTGGIDTSTGFALVASAETCFIWQHSQAVKGIPTCYIFSCPRDYDQMAAPLHGLIPYSTSREPGLILMSPSGQIRLWDSISIGLAGGDHFSSSSLTLSSDEYVTNLLRVDAQTFIASTSSGTLYRLMLVPLGGKLQLTTHAFARPSSALSLTRIYTSIFAPGSASTVSEPGNVNAVAVGRSTADGGKDVWALVDTRIQKWELKPEGWEDLLVDEELSALIARILRGKLNVREQDDARLDLEFLDIAINNAGMLVLLVSYAGSEDPNAMSINATRRFYALLHLRHLGTFNAEACHSVPYQSTSSSGAPMHPRVQLILGGDIISVQFGDAIALVATRSEYQDRLELKSSFDRTLGVGISNAESTILVLTSGVMLKAHIDSNNIRDVNLETGKINLIKSIMTQAVLYGSIPQNPLSFSFPPEVDEESLMQGAEQLSKSILESDPLLVLRNNDLHSQMTTRKDRLSFLIQFINDNAVLGKISQSSRQKLAIDAERLYAAHQLWLQHNDLLSAGHTFSVLHDAVHSYMGDIQEGHHEDIMRAFFKLRVADVGMIVIRIPEILMRAVNTAAQDLAELLPEANRVVLCILKSAFDYRDYNKGVYGLALPMINPWTSDINIIEVVRGLFDQTTKQIETPMPSPRDQELRAQLPELAYVLFACMHERLEWIESAAQNQEAGAQAELLDLKRKTLSLRPNVLETLRRNGHSGSAFSLAEQYHDFASLAALCNKEIVYPPANNPHLLRIQNYLDRFKEEFATELYRWYIQHGELRVLFTQDDMHVGYMDKFFATVPNPAISWIHDLGLHRYEDAALALLEESKESTNLASKRFMLSVGKLTHLAHLQSAPSPEPDKVLESFHDDLDFVSVHTELREDFTGVLAGLRGRQSLESQTDAIVKAKAAGLADRTALTLVFKDFVRTLLQGKVLSLEDAVDVLSLKDNEETPEAFAIALKLLIQAHQLPDARRASAFRSVWRRVYLHDDWPTLQKTDHVPDSELNDRFRNTALYVTFAAMIREGFQLEEYEANPQVALLPPTIDEISSRWPGMPSEDVESLFNDYVLEQDRLGELELDDVYDKVRVLAEEDILDLQT